MGTRKIKQKSSKIGQNVQDKLSDRLENGHGTF